MQVTNNGVSVTFNNPSPQQLEALLKVLNGDAPRTRKSKPEPTVSEDEDDNFGKKKLSKKDLDEDADEENQEDDEELEAAETDSEEDAEEDGLDWDTVKATVNAYGNKKPKAMQALLASFGFKGTAELKASKKKWEPVYRKIKAVMKAKNKD